MTEGADLVYNEQYIMKTCRDQLSELFPVLRPGFAGFCMREGVDCAAGSMWTDGDVLYYDSKWLAVAWERSPEQVRRTMAHVLLHLLYRDFLNRDLLYRDNCHRVEYATGSEANLILDLRVEFLLERECMHNGTAARLLGRNLELSRLMEKFAGKPMRDWIDVPEQMRDLVYRDSHALWPGMADQAILRLKKKWRLIALAAGMKVNISDEAADPGEWTFFLEFRSGFCSGNGGLGGKNGSGGIGLLGGSESVDAGKLVKGTEDYRTLLARFAESREEMELDLTSFDYIYYTLGMKRYGNIPLIGPLEYKEGHKADHLVIAIDTSGSCSVELIRRFLADTWAMLESTENFFEKMDVTILQCDAAIEKEAHISCREDWYRFMDHLSIEGRGGTDFGPAIERGKKLRAHGLIYFTDGDGVYPTEKPPFETVFVLYKEPDEGVLIPAWAKQSLYLN